MCATSVDISVIVPCRNEEKYINETIKRIINQRGANKYFTYELLIVDGKSTDDTVNIIRKEIENNRRIKLIVNKKRTTPSAFNLGIKNASGKYVCILGAHSEISEDYLISCLNAINSTKADNVGGPWKAKGCGYISEAIAWAFQNPFAVGGAKSHNLDYEGFVDTVWGGFYHKEVFDKIGFFDEDLVRNQDDELNYRLIKSGGKIWQTPKIKYFYICRNSMKKLFLQYYQYGFWKVLVIRKHRRLASIRHLVPASFVIVLALLSILSVFSSLLFKILFVVLFVYFGLNIVASFMSCNSISRFKLIPIMPVVFFCFHVGYGYGFCMGLINFLILKKPRDNMYKNVPLTR